MRYQPIWHIEKGANLVIKKGARLDLTMLDARFFVVQLIGIRKG